jgi:hypothetical protein
MAEESGLAKGFGGVWEWWVQNVLGGVGGITPSLAIVATFTMVILGALIYFLLRYLVLKQLAEKAGVQEEMLNGPSIVITISFLAITLWSGGIAMIAQMMSITVVIAALVFMILLIYFVIAMGKQGYAIVKGVSTSASTAIARARRSRLEARKENIAVTKEDSKVRREKEALNRFDKAKRIVSYTILRKMRGLKGLRDIFNFIRSEAVSKNVLNVPERSRLYIQRARQIYNAEVALEQYELKAEEYMKQVENAAGVFDIKDLKTESEKFEGAITESYNRTRTLMNKMRGLRSKEIIGRRKTLGSLNDRLKKIKGMFNKTCADLKKKENDSNKIVKNIKGELNQLKSIEKTIIRPFHNLAGPITNITNAIAAGRTQVIATNATAGLKIVNAVFNNTKNKETRVFNDLNNIENRLKMDLTGIAQDSINIKNELHGIDSDLKGIEQIELPLSKARSTPKGKNKKTPKGAAELILPSGQTAVIRQR